MSSLGLHYYDSPLHGCVTLPYVQQGDESLPENIVVYLVTPLR